MSKAPKRPRDPNQLAKLITDIATGVEDSDRPAPTQPIPPKTPKEAKTRPKS